MSPVYSFLPPNDTVTIRDVADVMLRKNKPGNPVPNLFVVASKAHMLASREEKEQAAERLTQPLEAGAARLKGLLPEHFRETDGDGVLPLKDCFFGYSVNAPGLGASFRQKLASFIEQ